MKEELQQLETVKEQLILYFATNGTRIVIAILIVVVGFWLGKIVAELILKICDKRKIDLTLARFFAGFAKFLVIAFAVITALSKAGIEITPFVALLGASAFGLSLAVQGPISNYGAGIILVITRPQAGGDHDPLPAARCPFDPVRAQGVKPHHTYFLCLLAQRDNIPQPGLKGQE